MFVLPEHELYRFCIDTCVYKDAGHQLIFAGREHLVQSRFDAAGPFRTAPCAASYSLTHTTPQRKLCNLGFNIVARVGEKSHGMIPTIHLGWLQKSRGRHVSIAELLPCVAY